MVFLAVDLARGHSMGAVVKIVLLNAVRQPLIGRSNPKVENGGLAYLAGALKACGIDFVILDNVLVEKSIPELVEDLPRDEDLLIAAHLMGRNWIDGLREFVRIARQASYRIRLTITGGQYASLYAQDILKECPEIDLLLRGEAEELIVKIASWAKQGDYEKILQLDTSCYVRLDLRSITNPYHYSLGCAGDAEILIWSSRGCHGNCTFCMIPEFYRETGRPWQRRPTSKIQQEILELYEKNGLAHYQFGDDSFVTRDKEDMQAVTEMLHLLNSRIPDFSFGIYARPQLVKEDLFCQWKEYGLRQVFLGIEAFNDGFLATLGKANRRKHNIRSIGVVSNLNISYAMGFIMISPYYSLEDVRNELRAIADYVVGSPVNPTSLFYALTNALLVYKGTKLYRRLSKQGLISEEGYDRFYDIYPYKIDPKVGAYLKLMKDNERKSTGPITMEKAVKALELSIQLADELISSDGSGEKESVRI